MKIWERRPKTIESTQQTAILVEVHIFHYTLAIEHNRGGPGTSKRMRFISGRKRNTSFGNTRKHLHVVAEGLGGGTPIPSTLDLGIRGATSAKLGVHNTAKEA